MTELPPPYPQSELPLPPQPGKSRLPLVIGLIVVAVLVLCGGIGIGGVLLFRARSGGVAVSPVRSTGVAPTRQPGTATGTPGAPLPGSAGPDASGGHQVTYEVTGSGAAPLLIYAKDESFGLATLSAVALPWQVSVHFGPSTSALYTVSAQNGGDGAITCRVLVDGREVARKTVQARSAMATCAGAL
jgi:hypothetical protein